MCHSAGLLRRHSGVDPAPEGFGPPSSDGAITGFSGWGKAKAELDAALTKINQPWTLHDIRHT